MKNLFNKETVTNISKSIKSNYSDFDHYAFVRNIEKELSSLELKERVNFITERLREYLPKDPNITMPILIKALKNPANNPNGLEGFSVWPLTHYVALFGLDHFELSMKTLKEMTKVFTSEFAVRPFIVKDKQRALKFLKECSLDENEHVRRWASEGTRPLLPWGEKLQCFVDNPVETWSILEKLKNDSSLYVRKSVANHVNDHSKNHPDLVIEKLLKWHHSKNKNSELSWVIKHASRSLIKKGIQKAFVLHGVEQSNIKLISHNIVNNKIRLGDTLNVELSIKNVSKKTSLIIVDHEIDLLKANGKHLIKVFKGKKLSLAPGEMKLLELKIPIKPVTTRVYYSGDHYWNPKINGMSSKKILFNLKVK